MLAILPAVLVPTCSAAYQAAPDTSLQAGPLSPEKRLPCQYGPQMLNFAGVCFILYPQHPDKRMAVESEVRQHDAGGPAELCSGASGAVQAGRAVRADLGGQSLCTAGCEPGAAGHAGPCASACPSSALLYVPSTHAPHRTVHCQELGCEPEVCGVISAAKVFC